MSTTFEHDPLEFATALSAKMASRSRHVCVFLGAGSAQACGLPGVEQLQKEVVSALKGTDKKAFQHQLKDRDLEGALTRIRRIAALVSEKETFDGLTTEEAVRLDTSVCKAIVKALDIQKADLTAVNNFAAWAARADYELPVELFTVNYDLLLESALEAFRVPYFDGFVGTIRAKFHTELVEGKAGSDREWMPAFFMRLWKLHGSVNWVWDKNRQIIRLGQPVPEGDTAAIFPSDTKYEESRRVPFVVLQDRFRRALHAPETLILISGYSFNDAHLNDMIFDAASHCPRSEFQVFCYGDIPKELAKRASITPNLQVTNGVEAILGGERRKWKPPKDPPLGIWVDDQFGLRDFKNLSTYLARIVTREPEKETLILKFLNETLTESVGKGNTKENA